MKPEFPLPPSPGPNPTSAVDLRAYIAELSRQWPPDPQAARAFLNRRIELLEQDAQLSETQKQTALAELHRLLKSAE